MRWRTLKHEALVAASLCKPMEKKTRTEDVKKCNWSTKNAGQNSWSLLMKLLDLVRKSQGSFHLKRLSLAKKAKALAKADSGVEICPYHMLV